MPIMVLYTVRELLKGVHMKKRILAVCMVMLIAVISCVAVWAGGYRCSSCGGYVYTTGCAGYAASGDYESSRFTCASHAGCVQTIHFFVSDMECMECGNSYTAPDACHAEYAEHTKSTNEKLCNY